MKRKPAKHRKQKLELELEALENRRMLSTVEVFATGSMGDEAFEVQVKGQTVLSVDDINGGGTFSAQVDPSATADDVRIVFTNDEWDPDHGIDRNLIVDKIVLHGKTYETEAASTYSTGTWNDGGFTPGH